MSKKPQGQESDAPQPPKDSRQKKMLIAVLGGSSLLSGAALFIGGLVLFSFCWSISSENPLIGIPAALGGLLGGAMVGAGVIIVVFSLLGGLISWLFKSRHKNP